MKISQLDPKASSGLNSPGGVGAAGAGSNSKQPAASAKASDQVQLSSLSGYLASALNGSPAHISKLAELGAAVSSGQYGVDADALSSSVIQHSIEFGGSGYSGLNVGG